MTNFLTCEMALALQARSIERHGGLPGPRDPGAFESAMAQPEATFGGELLHPGIFDQAAAYLFHLAKNHAFFDGNKRVALACALAFLAMNGKKVRRSENAFLERLTLGVAEGTIDKSEVARSLEAIFAQE